MSAQSRPGDDPSPAARTRPRPRPRPSRRLRYPDLSPTRLPAVDADAALSWPEWTDDERWELGPDPGFMRSHREA